MLATGSSSAMRAPVSSSVAGTGGVDFFGVVGSVGVVGVVGCV